MVLALAEHSPVLLWGITSEVKPALVTISQLEFAQLIANFLSNKSLVVFMENGVSVFIIIVIIAVVVAVQPLKYL